MILLLIFHYFKNDKIDLNLYCKTKKRKNTLAVVIILAQALKRLIELYNIKQERRQG